MGEEREIDDDENERENEERRGLERYSVSEERENILTLKCRSNNHAQHIISHNLYIFIFKRSSNNLAVYTIKLLLKIALHML